jgi:hypothetical protein
MPGSALPGRKTVRTGLGAHLIPGHTTVVRVHLFPRRRARPA